jgi:hypothetical protein
MHVHPAHQVAASQDLEVPHQGLVARLVGATLVGPRRERMGAGRDQPVADRARHRGHLAPEAAHLRECLGRAREHGRRDLDLGLKQLVGHVLPEPALAGPNQQLRHARHGVPAARVHQEELLLDAERELACRHGRIRGNAGGQAAGARLNSPRTSPLHPWVFPLWSRFR